MKTFSVWSAAPTPFTESNALDPGSLTRMVTHHVDLGVEGLFLAGTCGEGPWMTLRQTRELVKAAVAANGGRLRVAAQVTENSAARVLERMDDICIEGIDIAVVAQPAFFMNPTPARVVRYYLEILDRAPLPVCFYNRGHRPEFPFEPGMLAEICAHPRLVMVKDSSGSTPDRAALLDARGKRPELTLLNGDEFRCMEYLEAGYDGMMTGGAVLSGHGLRRMGEAFLSGDLKSAAEIDQRIRNLLLAVYGGEKIACWLTGLKYCLVRMGIFESTSGYLDYPLHETCRNAIHECVENDVDLLFPAQLPAMA